MEPLQSNTPRDESLEEFKPVDVTDNFMPPLTKRRFRLYAGVNTLVNVFITLFVIFIITRSDWGRAILLGPNVSPTETQISLTPTEQSIPNTPTLTLIPTQPVEITQTPTLTPTQPVEIVQTPTPATLECSYLKSKLNFLGLNLSTTYFTFPPSTCIHLENTGQIKADEYIEVRIWVWVKSSLIQENKILSVKGEEKIFFERPGENILFSDLKLAADQLLVEVTNNAEGDYTEIIIIGWLNKNFFIPPTPATTFASANSFTATPTSTP